ncbi:MAG TPA: hypothetical protein VK833_09980 [Gillisia sp.]|nr:hypothetical protein [Gillisia sp.]
MQKFQFENDSIYFQREISHIPGDQDKYNTKNPIVAPVSFFMRDQKDANKQQLEGDKKRKKKNQNSVHLLQSKVSIRAIFTGSDKRYLNWPMRDKI